MPDPADDRFPIDRDRFPAEFAETEAIFRRIRVRLGLRRDTPFSGEAMRLLMRSATPDEFDRLQELKDRILDGSGVPGSDERRRRRELRRLVRGSPSGSVPLGSLFG